MVTTYNQELQSVIDTLAPIKTSVITLRPNSRWFCDEIRAAKQQRRRVERLWRSSGLAVHREMFVAEKNHVTFLINETKLAHYRSQVEANARDQKQLFRILNSLTDHSKTIPLPPGEPASLAEEFSNFFIAKIRTIQESIPAVQIPQPGETVPVETPPPAFYTDHLGQTNARDHCCSQQTL
jgi:hypothetical protein